MNTLKDMKSGQYGFTMIELIVVIVILGILAAVALPRFSNIQRDARIAKLNAARGAVQSAAGIIHGTALVRGGVDDTVACADGVTADNDNEVCTEVGTINIVNGYPAASLPGIIDAAGLTSIYPAAAANLTTEGYATTIVAGPPAVITVQVTGGTDAPTCSFTYTEPTGVGTAATISAIDPAGC